MATLIGPRDGWWPAGSRFEVMIGAVLVQQTAWESAARSIASLRECGLLAPDTLAEADPDLVRDHIRPSGFMVAKARALTEIARWVTDRDIRESTLPEVEDAALRAELLALPGVGPETADAMMLFAFDRPVFVADAYARRLFEGVGWTAPHSYEDLRSAGMARAAAENLSVVECQELHALIDEYGKRVRQGARTYRELIG